MSREGSYCLLVAGCKRENTAAWVIKKEKCPTFCFFSKDSANYVIFKTMLRAIILVKVGTSNVLIKMYVLMNFHLTNKNIWFCGG